MLTRKQYELLLFIQRRTDEDGVAPSYDEMKEALGLQSKSGIHRLITALEERGFLRRLPHRARALEVIKLPDAAHRGFEAAAEQEGRSAVGLPRLRSVRNRFESDFTIPLYGKIAAGTPIEALGNHGVTIALPADMVGNGSHYALEISGDSMVGEGIMDGDTVIIKQIETANDGDIIVALVDDAEATLKTLRRRDGKVLLEPANPAHKTQTYDSRRIKIQGKLVGLVRKY